MELIIMRHGIAIDREEFLKKNIEEHLRPLTVKGRKKIQKIAYELLDMIDEIDLVVTSPLLRAKQTADILAQMFYDTQLVEIPELSPNSQPELMLKWLRMQARHKKRILIVGHEPHLSILISFLVTGQKQSFIQLKKGGFAVLKVEDFARVQAGQCQLLALATPKMILN